MITITGTSSNLTVIRRHEVAYDLDPFKEGADGTTPADIDHCEVADASSDERPEPAVQHSEPTSDNSLQTHGHDMGTDLGTELRLAAGEARTSAGTAPGGPADPISKNIHRSNINAHVGANSRQLSRFERERLRADARSALLNLGFRSGEAGIAVDLALRSLGDVPLEELLREALRCSRR